MKSFIRILRFTPLLMSLGCVHASEGLSEDTLLMAKDFAECKGIYLAFAEIYTEAGDDNFARMLVDLSRDAEVVSMTLFSARDSFETPFSDFQGEIDALAKTSRDAVKSEFESGTIADASARIYFCGEILETQEDILDLARQKNFIP